jgi:cell division protein FtsQ
VTEEHDTVTTTDSARAGGSGGGARDGGDGRGSGTKRRRIGAKGGGNGRGHGGRDGGASGAAARDVAVDPRMRARRIGVRRDAGQRRLRRITLVLLLVALLVGAAAASRSPLLDVDRVTVEGGEHTTADEVRREAAVQLGEPLVSVDVDAVRERVERLPWVDHATVSRRWPSAVNVQVTEREAVALVPVTGSHAALVDAEGRVLSIERSVPPATDGPDAPTGAGGEGGQDAAVVPPPGLPEGLALLTGVGGPIVEGGVLEGDAREALEVALALSDRLPGVATSVSVDLEAELAAGGVVRFGGADEVDAKVTAVETVLDQVDLACLAVLDVTVPGSPALTRHQGCS